VVSLKKAAPAKKAEKKMAQQKEEPKLVKEVTDAMKEE